MSLKTEIVKTALTMAISWEFPEAVVMPVIAGGAMDYYADVYDDSEDKKKQAASEKIDKAYSEIFSKKYFEEQGLNSEKIPYYEAQIKDILQHTPLDLELLSSFKNNTTGLCRFLTEKFHDESLAGYLDDEKAITHILSSILPRMIRIISYDQDMVFDFILQLVHRIGTTEKKLEELQRLLTEFDRTKQQEHPVFISDLPFSPSEHFIGREDEMENVYGIIGSSQSVMLYGLGGIGKTEIAKRVVNRIFEEKCEKHGIEKIAWVDYDNIDIRNCITRALHDTRSIKDSNEAWAAAQRIIMNHGNRLLMVIDNVENDTDKILLRLSNLPCEILITSRVKEIAGFQGIEVGTLSEEECITLFRKFCTKHPGTDDHVRQIVQLADCLTVVIELLAKIAEQEESTLPEFLAALKKLGFHLSNEESSSIHEKLQDEARVIEQIAKLFSIRPLKKEEADLLMPMSVIPSLAFSYGNAKEWFRVTNHKILNRLVKTGWLMMGNSTEAEQEHRLKSYYLMHSVIASAVRYQYRDVLYDNCRDFMCKLSKEMQYPNDEHGAEKIHLIQYSWAIRELLQDHYKDEQDADFMLYMARIFTDVANYEHAYLLLRHCVRLYARDKKLVVKQISCYNQIGLCFNYQDKCRFAITQYKKAFELAYKYQVDLELWVTLYADAALVFMKTDGYERDGFADTYLKSAYRYAVLVYGEHHAETRRIISLLNHCLATYDPQTAKGNFIRIIREEKEYYDAIHPQLAETYSSYALFLDDQGNYKESLKYYEKAFTIKNKVMGPKHPETADLANSIGLIYSYIGKTEEARERFNYCMEVALEREGRNSPTVATISNNIAILDFNEEKYEEAYDAFCEAEKIYRVCQRIYGNDFTEDISQILRNEGQCLTEIAGNMIQEFYEKNVKADLESSMQIRQYLKDAAKKMQMAIQLLIKEKQRYRFQIAQVYGSLASVYERLGMVDDTKKCYLRAIEGTLECRHEFHPDLAYLYNNYGQFLDDQGSYDEALYYVKKAEATMLYNGVQDDNLNLRAVRAAIKAIEQNVKGAGSLSYLRS